MSNVDLERLASMLADGQIDEVLESIDHNPNIVDIRDSNGSSLLLRAAHSPGTARVLAQLIALGANVNDEARDGDTVLGAVIEADRSGHSTLDELRTLLEAGADTNKIVNGGNTALQYAIHLGKLGHAELLLNFGARPDQKSADAWPQDAFDVARAKGNRAAQDLLARYTTK